MKIFTSAQIHELDKYTIEHEPVSSINLMERAAKALTHAITEDYSTRTPVVVFAGPGNNGGDALAVARLLVEEGYDVSVYLFNVHNHLSEDCAANKQRLTEMKGLKKFTEVTLNFDPPELGADTLVVDGLFGSGLNKPLAGGFAAMVKYINQSPARVVSIDMPSGLMCEDNTYNIRQNIVRADLTLTLQQKKLAMLLADNQPYIGRLRVLDIRLSPEYINKTESQYTLLEESDLRPGVGKVTVHTPKRNYDIMQMAVPEAVMQMDHEETYFSEAVDTEDFDALGIGPGLGQLENTAIALIAQIRRATCPLVIDADAINILANHRAWMQQLPRDIILTPHPKEFDRLSGGASNGDYDRLHKAQQMAEHLHAYIILKGHYSALCLPNGQVEFNPTGNSGMATAGSGDVLTGIITGLLARGYQQTDACRLGMYLHGLAGDIAAREKGKESLIAGDIIDYLPQAFHRLED